MSHKNHDGRDRSIAQTPSTSSRVPSSPAPEAPSPACNISSTCSTFSTATLPCHLLSLSPRNEASNTTPSHTHHRPVGGPGPGAGLSDSSLHTSSVSSGCTSTRPRPCCPCWHLTESPNSSDDPCIPAHQTPTRSSPWVPLRTHIPKAAQEAWARRHLHLDRPPVPPRTCPPSWAPIAHENPTTPHQTHTTPKTISRREHERATALAKEETKLPATFSETLAKEKEIVEDKARMTLLPLPVAQPPSPRFLRPLACRMLSCPSHQTLRRERRDSGRTPGFSDEPVRAFHGVVGIMVEGHTPSPVVSWISSASVAALRKQDGDHRQVAVGETLRRLTAWSLLAKVTKDTTRNLHPSQLGFGTASGCEATVHAIRLRCHDNDEERCLLTKELENAFNQIDKCCFLWGRPTSRARSDPLQ